MSTQQMELMAATTLRRISRSAAIKAYIQENTVIYDVLLRAARRYVGSEALPECLHSARWLQQQGHAVTINYLGEQTRDEATALAAAEEFLRVIEAISAEHMDASISLNLSHIGLAIDAELAYLNAFRLAQSARDAGIEVMIDMERMEYIDAILALHQQLCAEFENIGITLQAYLRRTTHDLAAALRRPGPIRLVKGAYEDVPGVVEPHGAVLDKAYRDYMEILLASGHACFIATHDLKLLNKAHRYIRSQKLPHDFFVFEMFDGVTPERLHMARLRGYRTRVYLPYGRQWYPYFCRRLAEYSPNIYRAIADAAGIEEWP